MSVQTAVSSKSDASTFSYTTDIADDSCSMGLQHDSNCLSVLDVAISASVGNAGVRLDTMESDDPLGLLESPPKERRRRRTRSRPPARRRVRLVSCERDDRPVSPQPLDRHLSPPRVRMPPPPPPPPPPARTQGAEPKCMEKQMPVVRRVIAVQPRPLPSHSGRSRHNHRSHHQFYGCVLNPFNARSHFSK
eukprot:453824-Amphidinium_carterae.2